MAVYRGFDQETLDAEYRARGTVPVEVFEAAVARYASDSRTGARDPRLPRGRALRRETRTKSWTSSLPAAARRCCSTSMAATGAC